MGHSAHAYQLGSRHLRTVGQTGVRISLTAAHGEHVVRRGTSVLVEGRTDPVVAGALFNIAAETYRHEDSRLTRVAIGSAATSSDGRFHIWWRPPGPGVYMIVAHLRHPGPGDLPDRGCDLTLTVH